MTAHARDQSGRPIIRGARCQFLQVHRSKQPAQVNAVIKCLYAKGLSHGAARIRSKSKKAQGGGNGPGFQRPDPGVLSSSSGQTISLQRAAFIKRHLQPYITTSDDIDP